MSNMRNPQIALPPKPVDNEQGLLGSLLRDPSQFEDVVSLVAEGDLSTYAAQTVWAAAKALWEAGRKGDAADVADELRRRGQIQDAPYAYLATLLGAAATGGGAVAFAKKVREEAIVRRVLAAAREVQAMAEARTLPPEELQAQAERLIFLAGESALGGNRKTMSEIVDEAIDRLDARVQGKPEPGLCPTGLVDLDRMLNGGFRAGQLVIAAARTGIGKSSLAMTVARNVGKRQGGAVFFASLEMPDSELADRLICLESGADMSRFCGSSPTTEELDRIARAHSAIKTTLRMEIDDEPKQTLSHLFARARRLKRKAGLSLVVVDYLQLICPEDRDAPRYEQVGAMSRGLKALAKDVGCPVLALAQLNRASEQRERPLLSDLRESGSIEQDADVVLLLYREDGLDNALKVDVAKNRRGKRGTITLAFEAEYTRFGNFAH